MKNNRESTPRDKIKLRSEKVNQDPYSQMEVKKRSESAPNHLFCDQSKARSENGGKGSKPVWKA